MSEFCACSETLRNTGKPNQQRAVSTGKKLFIVPIIADDGTENGIANTDTINQAFLDALVNNPDPSKRWYPIGTFVNQEDVRGDAITESFSDGSSSITQQGVRAYTGWLKSYAPIYIKNLKSFKCTPFGIYSVDACGDITGSVNKAGTLLRPIQVNEESWNPTYVKGTPTVLPKVQLQFEFAMLEVDESLRTIKASDITADFLAAKGLLELVGTPSAEATTGFIIDLKVDYDAFLDADKAQVPGWLLADFDLFNETDGATVTITSVTEAADGVYTFVIPAQTAADVLTLTNDLTAKPGFNLSTTVTIP